jgi:hypothetical protein
VYTIPPEVRLIFSYSFLLYFQPLCIYPER